ncbi:MAG: pyruvate synthase subunit beta [Candidatus Tectomicrobia bacterium]|nr:pyruvate synthase subunit beta [Candidatus Tectomicrobia bacterium]
MYPEGIADAAARFQETGLQGSHYACPGCGPVTAMRMILDVLGPNSIVFVPPGCGAIYISPGHATVTIPALNCVYASVFGQAAGYAYADRMLGGDRQVLVWGGDGAFFDIGLEGLSFVANQNYDIIALCNDNQGYQNTGHHSTTGTPRQSRTRSTPGGKPEQQKELMEILVAHRIPYAATISAAFPEDLKAKVARAASTRGFAFLHLLAPCINWGYEGPLGIKLARLSVLCRLHPLYEVVEGSYRLTLNPPARPVQEYTLLQRRFEGADAQLLQEETDARWRRLMTRCEEAAP